MWSNLQLQRYKKTFVRDVPTPSVSYYSWSRVMSQMFLCHLHKINTFIGLFRFFSIKTDFFPLFFVSLHRIHTGSCHFYVILMSLPLVNIGTFKSIHHINKNKLLCYFTNQQYDSSVSGLINKHVYITSPDHEHNTCSKIC